MQISKDKIELTNDEGATAIVAMSVKMSQLHVITREFILACEKYDDIWLLPGMQALVKKARKAVTEIPCLEGFEPHSPD